jgi:two-component system LytT family response regulator
MIKTILVDDERSSLESLSFELDAYCPDVKVIATCKDPQEGLKKIVELKPDLVFLDIEMPGMNGFELLQSLSSISFDVIFVTAYDQFAVRAFEFNAVDYILKPVRKMKLVQAVNKVQERNQHQFNPSQLAALMQNLQLQSKSGLEKIALPIGEGFSMVHVNDICYLKAESNYTWVHLISKEKHLIAKTLKEVEGLLNFPQYFRAHKSYLVNLNHVDKYVRGQGGYLVTSGGEHIPVARSQKNDLINVLKGL